MEKLSFFPSFHYHSIPIISAYVCKPGEENELFFDRSIILGFYSKFVIQK